MKEEIKMVKIKNFKDWKIILLLFAISITIAYVAFEIKNGFLNFLNVVSWIVLAVYLYKDVFKYINSLDMSNDLIFWISKIISGIGTFICLFLGLFFISAHQNQLITGLGILFIGAGLLGLFVLFRTKRNYNHIYVN